MWFRSLFRSPNDCPTSPLGRKSPRRPTARPRAEGLEDRSLLSAYVVDSLADTGAGSGLAGDLRYCITNATSGNDAITFGVTGTIELESALPALNASVAIQGPGASRLTVEHYAAAATDFGIFSVGSAATVAISGLTLTRGTMGAVTNSGALNISDCNLSGNGNSYGSGGAISNTGALTISRSTLAWNRAYAGPGSDGGGGAVFMTGGTLSIDSCTFYSNYAQGGDGDPGSPDANGGPSPGWPAGNAYGGALYIGAGLASIDHSTIAGNAVEGGVMYFYNGGDEISGLGSGGGIYNAGSLQMHDTIVAGDGTYSGQGLSGAPDLAGTFASLGHNLVGNSTGGSGYAASDLLDVDPLLGPLQDNGGPTQTVALLAGSPAINAGDNTGAPAYDQRGPGFPRIVGGAIDIGAFEAQTQLPPAISISDVTQVEGNVGSTAFVFTVQLSAASTQTVSVDFATADGTATVSDSDYQAQSGALTFAPGETSKTVTVLVNGDRRAEPNETCFVNLTQPTNAAIADGQGAGTILDDEPRISISDVTKAEGKKGKTTLFTFTVTLSAAYDQAVTMSFRTLDGTAKTSDSDYVAKTGTLTFAPRETSKTITIEVKGDSKREANETFCLDLFGLSSNSLLTKTRGLGTILNDD